MQLKIKLDIVRYRSLSEQAFLKVCKARLYIPVWNGALVQAPSTKLGEYTQRISRIRVGARVVSPRSVFLYVTEDESRRATPPKLERRRV